MNQTIKTTCILLALAITTSAFAQTETINDPMAAIMENLNRSGNNLSPYEPGNLTDTPAPEGYKPFYISHYGRHGSRSNFPGNEYNYLVATLEQAKQEGLLTSQGDSLLYEARQVVAYHDDMSGRLTARGRREHTQIAGRMYERFPEVFKGDAQLRVISSTVPRCLISMASFTNELARRNPELQISMDAGEKMQLIINTPDKSRSTHGSQEYLIAATKNTPDDSLSVLSVIFKDPKRGKEIAGSSSKLTNAIWETGIVTGDFDMPHNPIRFLSEEAIYKRWSQNNLGLYLNNCNSEQFGKARASVAKAAVDDFISKAEEAVNGGCYAADLRFGHDFPFLGIVSYLGIEGVGDIIPIDEVNARWFGFRTVQMASNVQAIFYSNASRDVLVKFLFQEQEVKLIGLAPVYGPYYRWDDIKDKLFIYDRIHQ